MQAFMQQGELLAKLHEFHLELGKFTKERNSYPMPRAAEEVKKVESDLSDLIHGDAQILLSKEQYKLLGDALAELNLSRKKLSVAESAGWTDMEASEAALAAILSSFAAAPRPSIGQRITKWFSRK